MRLYQNELIEWKDQWDNGDVKFVPDLINIAIKMNQALVSIAITGLINKDDLGEVYKSHQYNVQCAKWGLGWIKKAD